MSRILMLMIVVLWMSRSAVPSQRGIFDISRGVGLFVAGLTLVVLFMGLWSRVLARGVRPNNLHRSLKRFHASMYAARMLVPIWFGVAIFVLGWGNVVQRLLGPLGDWPVELPGMIIGTAPALLAWIALWWAQYPADHALREQNLLYQIDADLPVHAPPTFASYFTANLRLQVLFNLVPVMSILLLRDIGAAIAWHFWKLDVRAADSTGGTVELAAMFGAIMLVVVFMPEVLRHVLATQPLPASPLRTRLEEMCRITGMKYRDILLWKTNHSMGNAAVMGLIPQCRYILLSDMLLETMTDKQIQAVFAHELGHVRHRHVAWYMVLIATILMMLVGPLRAVGNMIDMHQPLPMLDPAILSFAGAIGGFSMFFIIFGYLSRWFERQADVFAARIIEQQETRAAQGGELALVGPTGAATFASALKRVAIVNNIPIAARNFTHGSIAERMRYLHDLAANPARTLQFDRAMSVIYAVLICSLLACGAWFMVTQAA